MREVRRPILPDCASLHPGYAGCLAKPGKHFLRVPKLRLSSLYTNAGNPSFRSGMPESIVQGWQTGIMTDVIVFIDGNTGLANPMNPHHLSVQCQAPFLDRMNRIDTMNPIGNLEKPSTSTGSVRMP